MPQLSASEAWRQTPLWARLCVIIGPIVLIVGLICLVLTKTASVPWLSDWSEIAFLVTLAGAAMLSVGGMRWYDIYDPDDWED
jgi:hypothetical protein